MRKRICLFVALIFLAQAVMLNLSMEVSADVPLGTTPSWTTTGNYDSEDVALGDFDHDGDLDLASYGDDYIHVYRNENGQLSTTAFWNSTESTSGVSGRLIWADINNDNYPELFTSLGMYDNNNGVLSGSATWTKLSTVETFTLGHVNGDNYIDLVLGDNDLIELYTNNAGVIDSISDWNTTEDNSVEALALGDIDNDNYNELAVGNDYDPIRIYDNVAGTLNNVSMWNSTLTDYVGCLTWGDINNDNYPELYACTQPLLGEVSNRMYINSGGSLETSPSWNSSSPTYATDATFADLEGDGDLDLLVSNYPYIRIITQQLVNGTEMVYLNEGGVIDEVHDWTGAYQDNSYGLDVGDVNGDSYLDLFVANKEDLLQTYPGRVVMYSGRAPNQPPQITSVSANPQQPKTGEEATISVQATDPDGDTLTYDFSVASGHGTIVSVSGSTAVWRAPNEVGNYTINITVSDGKDGFAYRDFKITVVEPSEDGVPFFSLENIWFLMLLLIIIIVIIIIIVAVAASRRRKGPVEVTMPPEEEFPPPPPPP